MNTEVPRRVLPGAARVASLWVLLSALACGDSGKSGPADARPVAPRATAQKIAPTDLTASATTTSPTFSSYIATLPPATVTASVTQTLEANWDPSLQSLNYPPIYPQGWAIEYYAGSTKLATTPTTTSEWAQVSRVRAVSSVPLDVEGVDGERQAIVARSKAPRVTVRERYPLPSGVKGDGWDVLFDPAYTRFYNVHHHNNLNQMLCRELATGNLCPGFPINLTQTSIRSTGFIDAASNKFWQPTVTDVQPFKLAWDCVDLTNGTRCARPVVLSELTAAHIKKPDASNSDLKNNNYNDHIDPVVIGRKMYAIGFASDNRTFITCLDMATGTECPGKDLGLPRLGNANQSGLAAVGNQLYVVPGRGFNLDCYDSTTWNRCSGTWPQPVSSISSSPVWAVPGANGEIQHVCANNVCFKLDGSPHSLPPGFAAEIQAHRVLGNLNEDVQNGGASSYGSKVAWAYGITAPASERASKAMCWDMATDAKCGAGFPITVPVLYTTIFDPENPDCLWTNTDNGEINSWRISTGTKGCTTAGATRISFKTPVSVPRLSCDPESRVYQYKSFTLTTPGRSTYTSATLTVRDSNGKPLAAWSNLPIDPANPVVDLNTLSTLETGLTPSFDVAVAGIDTSSIEPESEIRVTTGAPPQLCWDLSSPPFAACPLGPALANTTDSPPRETVVTAKGAITINPGTPTSFTDQPLRTTVATANFDTCGARLRATVVSLSDGSPVAGAKVFLLDSEGNPILDSNGQPVSAVSAADGTLEFPVWAADYTLKMSGTDSYIPAYMNVTAGGSGTTAPVSGTVTSNTVTTTANQISHVQIAVTSNQPTPPPPPAENDEAWFQGSGCTAVGGAQSALVVLLVLGGLAVLRRRRT
ncbi:hypothetical protein [Cystobacter ferrugineus]|uniref:hypothetical protein n=1 Tax=Cystobacter ferrugineus TaxID=83449 RepID=UPI0011613B1F|nr:hypothetical protein [Cystobacter ferrugineus]